jgi:hypothetical protein
MKRRAVLALTLTLALGGLAVAAPLADSVDMHARATVLRSGEVTVGVYGTISSGAEGAYVAVKGLECGIPGAFFRGIGGATTTAGGAWEATLIVRTKTTFRAEWKDAKSASVIITPRADIRFTKEKDGYQVGVASETSSVDGKRAVVQRLTPTGWKTLQTVVLKSEGGYAQYGVRKKLKFKLPKGTTIRAVFPRSQTGPCYLAGYSKLLRT